MTPPEDWTVIRLLQWTSSFFESHGIASHRLDAELLLAEVLGVARIDLYLRHDQPLNSDELEHFRGLVKRRRNREPVAYLLGEKAFWTLDLSVGPEALIPRPETECLVEAVLAFLKDRPERNDGHYLDLGTGSGAIALALAASCPAARVSAVDRSLSALALAARNRRRHQLQERLDLVAGNWLESFSPIRARFDVITSNPPYIPSDQIDGLQPEVSRYEPRMALDGGRDGLDCIRVLLTQAPNFLAPGGALFLEIGHDQYPDVQRLGYQTGRYQTIECLKDYSGLNRVAFLMMPSAS